jgi:DNA-binding PadR family transcriptional regulator
MWSGREYRFNRFNRFRERMFEKGDLKYVILELLKDKPAHGYELIKALEERLGGFYAPSPGAVYPTLQMLEDLGYVTAVTQDGKKVYSITDAGNAFLAERRPLVDEIFGRMRDSWDPAWGRDLHRVMRELGDLGRSVAGEARNRWPTPDQMRRIRETVGRARTEIEGIMAEERAKV